MRLKMKSGFWILTLLLAQAVPGHAADLKPDELVAHHLDSLGTAAVRSANKSRVVQGTAKFKMLVGGGGQLEGKSAVVSEEHKLNILMKFANDYRGEQFISDGNKSSVAATTSEHRRTIFGEFVMSQPVLLQDGLLGGALSTAWALSNVDSNHPRLSVNGLKKVDGKQLLDLRYQPKRSTEMDIHMYFDPETYRHVQTVYTITLASGLGGSVPSISDMVGLTTPGGPEWQRSDPQFKAAANSLHPGRTISAISIPQMGSHYPLTTTSISPRKRKTGKTTVYEWDVMANEVSENMSLDPRNFQVK